ncbi:hypothetical protein MASR1M32_32280 [Rhodobacter sp.]
MSPASHPDCRTIAGSPVVQLATPFGVEPTRLALATPSLAQHLAVVDLSAAGPEAAAAWSQFTRDYAVTRQKEATGLSLLVLAEEAPPQAFRVLDWHGRVPRADAGLWADIHAQTDRPEPLGGLIHAVAVELLGWRLDLVRSFMRVAQPDALDPISWLERRRERPGEALGQGQGCAFGGKAFACPLDLLRRDDWRGLQNRLWRAHLAAIFPWIEEQRQILLERHADQLEVGERHRRDYRVLDVRDLEISEIARQLRDRSILQREEQIAVNAMGEIRKNLAHRMPAHRNDLRNAISYAPR